MVSAATLLWLLPVPENQERRIMLPAFVVPRGTPGFTGGKKENKLGMRASETAEMIFDNCRIPDSYRLGNVGDGFKQSLKVLDGGRISIAALGVGIAKGAYEAAVKYSKEDISLISRFLLSRVFHLNWPIWLLK